MKKVFLVGFVAILGLSLVSCQDSCQRRDYVPEAGQDYDVSFVCVCDASGCDFPPAEPVPEGLNYTRIVTSRDQYRFDVFEGVEESTPTGTTTIIVEHFLPPKQTIFGFGSSFTDSAGINIKNLSPAMQDTLMTSYFGDQGIDYNLCRVPIAGSDFSTYAYSYDDWWMDVNLVNFSLTVFDYDYKIPLIQQAANLSSQDILILGSPWAPPAWMKTNGMHNGTGALRKDMWVPYANYLTLFIDEYEENGVPIWGLTPQNEPLTGSLDWEWNTCFWSKEDMRDWIATVFGPKLKSAGYQDKILLVHDFNRASIPEYPAATLSYNVSAQYVQGTAVHWYDDATVGPERLEWLHGNFTDKFILYTEACSGWGEDGDKGIHYGSWDRAQIYAANIIEDLNYWSTGWIDWNMALSTNGGPNWAGNFVDSPIIVNATADEFLKQPTFYSMGHFSKYVKRDAEVLETLITGSADIVAVALHNPNGEEVIVVLNKSDQPESMSIETHQGEYINFEMNAKSIESIFYAG